MAAQEYFQGHPQNPNPYGSTDAPPQYQQPYSSPAPQQQKPPIPAHTYSQTGTPQPQAFQQPYLPPPPNQYQQQVQQHRPPMPPPLQTHQPYTQAPSAVPSHLRPSRSYSAPPSPRDYSPPRHRHGSHDRRRRSPSSSEYSSDSERSRSRHRHHHHTSHHLSNADKARGLKESSHNDRKDHSTRNTFLGAFGGSAIGDLIVPGLGTIGGALLGGYGGHAAGRSRSGSGKGYGGGSDRYGHSDSGRSRTRKRDKYDEEWEAGRRRRGEI